MIDINKMRRLALDGDLAAMQEIILRLEAAESECLEQARLNGMGGEREAALMAKLEAAEKSDAESLTMYRKARDERDALRAEIEAMERQAPVAWTTKLALEHRESALGFRVSSVNIWGEKGVPLYALPGAHPKPDCGEAGHDEGRCGNAQCSSDAKGE